AAAMTGGLCRTRRQANACVLKRSIGITALGATDGAVGPLVEALRDQGKETTVFHANGFGGAAFTRFAERGAFSEIVDLTPHELTRLHLAGAHVPMEGRFAAGRDVPRVVLPGGLNFIGLGEKSLVPLAYLERPHYEHSGFFTHVKVTPEEMIRMATLLAEALNESLGATQLIVPMGGFSHQDREEGEIEDPGLREAFLNTVRKELSSHVRLTVLDAHLFDPIVTAEILRTLDDAAEIPRNAAQ
ncbi:MAG: Tm-1-like ATP-binding domain-containing protein, partial [Pseudomonadota bacterium]